MRKETLFKSKRNRVMLVEEAENKYVIKQFTGRADYDREVEMYRILNGTIHTPRIWNTDTKDISICMTYLPGMTALQILEEQEKGPVSGIDFRIWQQLLEFLQSFYEQMDQSGYQSFCLGDLNLRNYIYNQEEQCFYGVDFELCQTGFREKDIANLCAYILLYDPKESEHKKVIAEFIIQFVCKEWGMDRKCLIKEVDAEKKTKITQRRKCMENRLQKFVAADPEKCIGCRACEIACFAEHNRKENHVGQTVGTVSIPVIPRLFLTRGEGICTPVQCRHCEDAPCMQACTLHAIERRGHQIVINQKKCTGCKDCVMACPFGAIELQPSYYAGEIEKQPESDESRKAAYKCDFCIDSSDGPACVRACRQKSLRIVELQEETDLKRQKAARILNHIQG